MRSVVLVIFEIRVTRSRVESRSCFRLARAYQRLLKSNFVGTAVSVAPVVAIVSEREDGLCRIQLAHPLDEVLFKPLLRGQRTGIAIGPMLVVGHDDQVVAGSGIGGVIPIRIVKR